MLENKICRRPRFVMLCFVKSYVWYLTEISPNVIPCKRRKTKFEYYLSYKKYKNTKKKKETKKNNKKHRKKKTCHRGENQGSLFNSRVLSEIIVGEIIAKSP